MSDVEAGDAAPRVMEIAITKAKRMIAVTLGPNISDEMFDEIIYRGLADILNSGMSKITVKDLEGAELTKAQDAAIAKAEENLKSILAGSVKHKGARGSATKTKTSREVTTEATRLARDLIKDHIRADGGKPSHFKPSDITKWAKELLESATGPGLFAQAEASIEARKTAPIAISLAGLKPDAGLVAKAAAKAKPKAAGQLSAKQAGKTAPPRSKPKAEAHTSH